MHRVSEVAQMVPLDMFLRKNGSLAQKQSTKVPKIKYL